MFSFVFLVPYIVYAVLSVISVFSWIILIFKRHNLNVQEIDQQYVNEKLGIYSFGLLMSSAFASFLFLGLMFGSINNEYTTKYDDWLTFFSTVLPIGAIFCYFMLISEKVSRRFIKKDDKSATLTEDD